MVLSDEYCWENYYEFDQTVKRREFERRALFRAGTA